MKVDKPDDSQRPEDMPEESYVPASPAKRALAWTGVVYMILFVILITYNLFAGEVLYGSPGILLFPACGGLAALFFLRYKARKNPILLLCGFALSAACVFCLVEGITALLRNYA